jgi:transporter family-2 protein
MVGSARHLTVRGDFMIWLSYLVALAAGAANPFQSGTNAQLNKQLGQSLWAGIAVYVTGLGGLLLLQLIWRQPLPALQALAMVKPWAWFGGLVSIASTMAGLTLAQRIGSGMFTGLSLTASLVTSVVLDQLGVLGFRQHTASPVRLAGCALMIAGVWLVAKF